MMYKLLTYTALALSATLLSTPPLCAQGPSCLGLVEQVQPGDVCITIDSLDASRSATLSFTLDPGTVSHIAPQHSSCILPVLETADRTYSYAFAPIYIDGRVRAKAIDRLVEFGKMTRPSEGNVIRKGQSEEQQYCSSIAYSPDMLGSRLVFYEVVTGCASCTEHEDSLIVGGVLPEYRPEWQFAAAPATTGKLRSLSDRADLKFIIDRWDIRPELADNRNVLRKVEESVGMAADSSLFTILSISFFGYASPDGPEDNNNRLAYNRAHSLMDYVIERFPDIDRSLFSDGSLGEDWPGLFAATAADSSLAGNAVLQALRESEITPDNWRESERMLKSDKRLFEYLKPIILPSLRRTEYTIQYSVRGFSPEEALALWQDRPGLLSVAEFESAANLFPAGSRERSEILLAAARANPGDPSALGLAALALRAEERHAEAAGLLEGESDAGLLNLLGVLLAESGQYAEAEGAFTRASGSGNAMAGHNLEELRKLIIQK